MQHFTSIRDVANPGWLVNEALWLKEEPFAYSSLGRELTLGMIFLNPSLRTRLSTQRAAENLGMNVMVMNYGQDSWGLETRDGVVMDGGAGEHIREAARVIGQYCDIIGLRTFPSLNDREEDKKDLIINMFRELSGRPIVSLESSTLHPLQSLADMVTIREHWQNKDKKPKVALTWAPHIKDLPQSVPNSFAQWATHMDEFDFVIAHPEGYDLDPEFTGGARVTHDQDEALSCADFVYAKSWSSYGGAVQPREELRHWQIDQKKMKLTNPARFMHCLPVRRNLVVSDEVMDSEQAIVIEQAKNRECSAQAVLKQLVEQQRS